MAEQIQLSRASVRTLSDVLAEVKRAVEQQRASGAFSLEAIRDLRWQFDQDSAKMNQAIYNEHPDKIHETCLKTVSALIEILARS